MKNNIEVISLIYKSVSYLDFIVNELKNIKCDSWDVGIRLVANDANQAVLDRLATSGINYSVYYDPKPNDYYLNRVYRCWNYSGYSSNYDNICFVNSDMMFSENWLNNLLKHHDGINIPTSRLVESGKMASGLHGISHDCGRNPSEINKQKWSVFTKNISEPKIEYGGLYMPCVFSKKRFIESGMYPEGNIYIDGIGTCTGRKLISGDRYFFKLLEDKFSMKHITVFDSLVYHIQEGEMDE